MFLDIAEYQDVGHSQTQQMKLNNVLKASRMGLNLLLDTKKFGLKLN